MAKINGMSVECFFDEMKKPIPVKSREDGSTYFSVAEIRRRVQELLLPSNYNYSCTPVQLFNIGSAYTFSLVGKLEVKDDDGNTILIREVPGGSDVKFLKSDPSRPTNDLKTVISTAESSAFVNCWLAAGLSSCVDLSYKKEGNGSNSSPVQRTDEVFDIEFVSDLSANKDMVQGKVKVGGEVLSFRVFKEGLSYFENNNKSGKTLTRQEVLKCLVGNYGVSKTKKSMKCYGYFNEWNGQKQFVLTKGA